MALIRNYQVERALVLVSIILCFISSHSAARGQEIDAGLYAAITERLSYMEEVALYKARNHLPIEDIDREGIVLNRATEDATREGMDRESAAQFFAAQIAAAKAIQFRYRAAWLVDNTIIHRVPKDLNEEIRPALLHLGTQITVLLGKRLHENGPFTDEDRIAFMAAMNITHLSSADKERLFTALKQVRLK